MRSIVSIIGATLCLAGQSATPQTLEAEPTEMHQEPVYVAPTRPDRVGRIMVPVYVNGRGPYAFVIDTGATRSAIAPHVVAELGLVPDPERQLVVRGVTGTASMSSVKIKRLRAGEIVLENQLLPVIEPRVFADADGILGVEGFDKACLHANFINKTIAITRNGCPNFRKDMLRISADLQFGRLVVVKGRIRRTSVNAIIDTGAARSLGNEALLHALEFERQAEEPLNATQVLGATDQRLPGSLIGAPPLYLGEIRIADIEVTFGDFEVFRMWNLDDEPAILVGMDVLGVADALMIDYRRSELRVQLPGTMDEQRIRQGSWPGRLH